MTCACWLLNSWLLNHYWISAIGPRCVSRAQGLHLPGVPLLECWHVYDDNSRMDPSQHDSTAGWLPGITFC